MNRITYNILIKFIFLAYRSRFLARLIFGIDFKPVGKGEYYFDVTTLVLVKKAEEIITESSRVLDMGAGTAAVIGISMWKRLGCHVIVCDVNPDIVILAKESVRHNQAPIKVVHSNYFDNIDEGFDTVFFNPPYVVSKTAQEQKHPGKFRSQWDGGPDGTTVIKGFIDAFKKLKHSVTAYLGVNRLQVKEEKIIDILKACSEITSIDIYRHPILPVNIYSFKRNI